MWPGRTPSSPLHGQPRECLNQLLSSSSPVRKIFRGSSVIPCRLKLCVPFFFIDSPKNILELFRDPTQFEIICAPSRENPRNSSSLAAPHPSLRQIEVDEPHQHRQRINGLVFNGCSHETHIGSPVATPLLLQVTPTAFSPLIQLAITAAIPSRNLLGAGRFEALTPGLKSVHPGTGHLSQIHDLLQLNLVPLLWTPVEVVTVDNNPV